MAYCDRANVPGRSMAQLYDLSMLQGQWCWNSPKDDLSYTTPLSSNDEPRAPQCVTSKRGASAVSEGKVVQYLTPTVSAFLVSPRGSVLTERRYQKRRMQNRAAQRAYRERKDSELQRVKDQLQELQCRYHALVEAQSLKEKTIQRLHHTVSSFIADYFALQGHDASWTAEAAHGMVGDL